MAGRQIDDARTLTLRMAPPWSMTVASEPVVAYVRRVDGWSPTVGWRDVWAVVRASALRRLGKPLLLTYLGLAMFGVAVVVASVTAMWLGHR